MSTKLLATLSCIFGLVVVWGCSQPPKPTDGSGGTALTPGLVKKEIHVGMAQAEVAEALGSPNLVSRDAEGSETWIYDKVATKAEAQRSSSGVNVLIFWYGRERGTVETSQRTLTVVIKFDAEDKVKSFSYHASKF